MYIFPPKFYFVICLYFREIISNKNMCKFYKQKVKKAITSILKNSSELVICSGVYDIYKCYNLNIIS